jgi:hypothetical protein
MSDEPLDLVAFAVEVDRWLMSFADGRYAADKAALDAQATQILYRDDLRALLEPALRDAPQDVFAIASRIILMLLPRAAAGSLPLSLEPPLVAALALRIFDLGMEAAAQERPPIRHVQRIGRRRSRRWSVAESCQPRSFAHGNSERPKTIDRQATELVDLAQRPKRWHCVACGWRCDDSYNDYRCEQCNAIRPFLGGSATMIQCRDCRQWNFALARFCEWCGENLL